MLVPYEWLVEFVPGLPPPNELAEALTMSGTAVEAVVGEEEPVFDLEITHNRPDCLSIFGAAREASAVLGLPLCHPDLSVREEGRPADELASVDIDAPDLCGRYIARMVTDVRIGPSPDWMQARLLACGIRPVNNIVDVTNYVMLEVGQPLHAFDRNALSEGRILVRRARPGETITTIDGESRQLNDDMLVIADPERAVAVAGVMGGLETEVGRDTAKVLLESATFDAVSVWRTSRSLRMRTEASARFSRGLWPENARIGVDRACALIAALGAGKVAPGRIDVYPGRGEPAWICLRPHRVCRLLGTSIEPDDMKAILMRLGFVVEDGNDGGYRVLVPDHRMDIGREEDLVEEIARVYGYERIEPTIPHGAPPEIRVDLTRRTAVRAGEILRACGLTEVETMTLASESACQELMLPAEQTEELRVAIANPISQDHTMLRTTLLASLLDVLKRNAARREDDIAIYEIGRVFHKRSGRAGASGAEEALLPHERTKIGLALAGKPTEDTWRTKPEDIGFFDLKGVIEALLDGLGIEGAGFEKSCHPSLHPGRCARVMAAGCDIGYLGELHPDIREGAGLKKRAYLAELDFEGILSVRQQARKVLPLPRFPAVTRDIAIVVRQATESTEVLNVIIQSGAGLIEDVKLFDIYEGPQVPTGHKSLAYSIRYRSGERTLTDDEVEVVHQAVIEALAEKLGASVRR